MNSRKKFLFYLFGTVFFIFFLFHLVLSAPKNFPVGAIVTIPEGSSLRQVSFLLQKNNVINSRSAFELFVILGGGERRIQWGDYLFDVKESVYKIASRIQSGDRHLAPVKITIPEGYTSLDIAGVFALKLSLFDKQKFLLEARPKEGYLFPDTYF